MTLNQDTQPPQVHTQSTDQTRDSITLTLKHIVWRTGPQHQWFHPTDPLHWH